MSRTTTQASQGSGPRTLSVYEALIRIESRQFLREMNASSDYSYLDTPRSGAPIRCAGLLLLWNEYVILQLVPHGTLQHLTALLCLHSNTTNIVPRLAEPNTHIPAYLDSRLAWGGQPIPVRFISNLKSA